MNRRTAATVASQVHRVKMCFAESEYETLINPTEIINADNYFVEYNNKPQRNREEVL